MIDRAGAQAASPEGSTKHDNRHVQTGKFIRKGAASLKASGSKKQGTIPMKPKEQRGR